MKRFLQLFKFKRIVSILLLISMLSSYFLVEQTDLNYTADANALQINYINLMKGGKAGVTGNTDAIMTMDDLRCVAMFLSQSYVPFCTSLDGDSKDKWVEKSVQMLRQIGFDQQVATTLVNATYEATLNSASKIYIDVNDLGQVKYSNTHTGNGFGRCNVQNLNNGWYMPTDGAGSSTDFAADTTIYMENKWYDAMKADTMKAARGDIPLHLVEWDNSRDFYNAHPLGGGNPYQSRRNVYSHLWSNNEGDTSVAHYFNSSSNPSWVGVENVKCGGHTFLPYTEGVSSAVKTYALVPYVEVGEIEVEENGQTKKKSVYSYVGYVMVDADSVPSAFGGSKNRFYMQGEAATGTTGIMNENYRKAVKDKGYAGYTPLTLEEFWVLADNLYYDYANMDMMIKVGHKQESYSPVYLYTARQMTSVSVNEDSETESSEEKPEETEESTTADTAKGFLNTMDVYATEGTEVSTEVETTTPSEPYLPEQNGDLSELVQCGVLDEDLFAYLAYVVANNSDISTGGVLNAFVNADINSLFSGENQTANNSELEALISLFQCLYVDWVGNIIVDVGTERVVLVPACANKFAFTDIEVHKPMQNILSPLWMRLLGSSDSVVNADSIRIGSENKTYKVDEVLSRGNNDYPHWDLNKGWWAFGLGNGAGFQSSLENVYGVKRVGDGNNKGWTETNCFNLLMDVEHTKSDVFSTILVYESIKQSGKGTVTDLSSTLISTSVLESWSSYSNYFSAEGSSKFSNSGDYDKYFSFSNNDVNMLQNLFLTYVFAYTNHTYQEPFDKSKHYIDMRFNYDAFPKVDGSLQWESVDSTDAEIASFVYYFLHPTKGIKYVATWFKNKVSGIFINWHEDIVGSSDSNSVTGMTQYLGFSGYVTTPNLEDISWISSLVSGYDSIIIYLIIIMMVVLICYVLVGAITLQRGIIGVLMFAFLAFLPPIGINTTVNIINKTCESMYSTKFDYWAAVQTEEYLGLLTEVENAETVTDYVTALMQTNAEASASTSMGGASATGYSGVKVKWLSPKKFNEMAAFSNEVQDKIDKSKSGMSGWMLNALVATQEYSSGMEFYLSSDSASYLYRDLLDIYRYGSCSYYAYTGNVFGINSKEFEMDADFIQKYGRGTPCVGNKILVSNPSFKFNSFVMANMEDASGSDVNLPSSVMATSSLEAMRKGYMYPTIAQDKLSGSVNYFDSTTNTKAASLLLINSKCIEESVDRYNDLKGYVENGSLNLDVDDITQGKHEVMFGLGQWMFKGGINEFITGSLGDYELDKNGGYDGYYYSLYSESPYYFFSFNIRDQVHSSMNYNYDYQSLTNSAGDDDFYKLLVKDNQGYFYNLSENAGDGYGELRDFMNLHDFFYYVMPVLKPGNDLTNLFADVFGMETSDHSTLHLSSDGQIHYSGTTYSSLSDKSLEKVLTAMSNEELYEFWHDYNVRTVYNAYTPWLNLMYACDYAEPEKIHIMGETFTVSNPLDPTSYFLVDENGNMTGGRYMVFSRSEQKANGIQWSDLTSVEQKIITLQENVYAQAIRIMDYYNLSNETLISYMAMLELFEFNKVFSQESMLNGDYILYPQSYELKAFTYDAYLRLILNGATEGSNYQDALQVTGGQSIYERILEKTSIFFGIVLLANDFVAVYLIPMLKLFFLVTIFLVSILIIVAATTKLETPGGGILQAVWKSLVAPLGMFAIISIGMAGAVVLFMSSGGGNVTKKFVHISLGDPTMTCIAMLIINVVALILYYKLCAKVFKDFKKYVTSVFDTIGSNVVGAVGRVAGVVAANNAMKRLKNIDRGINGGNARTASQRGRDNIPNSESARTSEGMLAKSGGGMSGAGGIGDTGGSGVAEGSAKASYGSKYDAKLKKQEKKENVNLDKYVRAQEKADNYAKKVNADPQKLDKLQRKADKREAASDNLAEKHRMMEKAAQRKQDFSKEKSDNIKKYGHIYGTAKNVGATLSYTKESAKGVRDKVSYNAGSAVSRFETFGGDVKQFGSDVKQAGRQAVDTVKRMPAAAKGARDYVSDTVARGANRVYRAAFVDPYARQEIRDNISRQARNARRNVASAAASVKKNVWSTDSYIRGRSNSNLNRVRTKGLI